MESKLRLEQDKAGEGQSDKEGGSEALSPMGPNRPAPPSPHTDTGWGGGVLSIPPTPGCGTSPACPVPSPKGAGGLVILLLQTGQRELGETESQIPKLFWCDAAMDAGGGAEVPGEPRQSEDTSLGLCPSYKMTLLPPDLLRPGLFIADGCV